MAQREHPAVRVRDAVDVQVTPSVRIPALVQRVYGDGRLVLKLRTTGTSITISPEERALVSVRLN